MPKPTLGRTVLYTLSAFDVELIEERRAGKPRFQGNPVSRGQEYSAVVVAVPKDVGDGFVSLKVYLDGNDCHWAPARYETPNGDADPGYWRWPPRE